MAVLQSTLRLSLLDQVSGPARQISGVLNGFTRQSSMLTGTIGRLVAFGGAYLGVTQGIRNTAGAAIDFESAFADVRKVVEASEEQFANMRRTIIQMSTELPISATGIAALFAAAGEAGIPTEELKTFSEMAARVGIAFDMSAGDAGEALAKLKTQLGLTVAETGDMADAINHLSNGMASKASEITAYMLRVGSLAEMGGFAKEEIAAIGSAMIAAGAQAETAATAMQNVVKAMTRGKFAKKGQQEAADALGLNLPEIAKQMQKDAPKALKRVLGAIAKAPKSQHIALLSQFFGDEAKAFAPLIGDAELLEKALESVSDKTKYAGSAFEEYRNRAATTANQIERVKNNVAALGIAIGDNMLPAINRGLSEILDIFATLGERVTVFDKIGTAISGFASGLGAGGAVRQLIDDIKELLFGEVDGSKAADQMGRIFAKFKEWGASVRELTTAIANNPIAKFFGDLAGYGPKIMLWGIGIAMLAGTIRKLAAAMMLLSGASTILAALKVVGGLATIVGGGTAAATGAGAAATTGAGAAAATAATGGWKTMLLGLGRISTVFTAAMGAYEAGKASYTGDTFYSQGKSWLPDFTDLLHSVGSSIASMPSQSPQAALIAQMALDNARAAREMGIGGRTTDTLPGKTADDVGIVRIDASSIAAMVQPTGVQQVHVTNQQPPNVTVHAPVTITGISDAPAATAAAAAQLGSEVKSAVESGYLDSQ